jgi:hypothetical protein
MQSYIVRVELHGADYQDYEQLHVAMAQRGLSRIILGSDGQKYQLPTAEYVISTVSSLSQVRDAARAAAATTGRSCWVLVSEYSNCGWFGLPKAS